jgi:hypothetical protein
VILLPRIFGGVWRLAVIGIVATALRQFLCALERHDVGAIESLLANGARTMTDGGGEFRAALMIALKSDRRCQRCSKPCRPSQYSRRLSVELLVASFLEYSNGRDD